MEKHYSSAELQQICENINKKEQESTKAERDSIKFKQTEYMKSRVGSEFAGTVSGANSWGLFIEITENGCDGMVDSDELSALGFVLDEKNYKFVNDNGKKIALGDAVKIRVNSVNLTKRQIDLSLVDTNS